MISTVYSTIPDGYALWVARPSMSRTANPVAARLLKLRESAGFTQTDLGRKARVKQGDISKYETTSRLPTVPVLLRLAVALDVTVDALVRGLDPMYDARHPLTAEVPISPEAMARAWSIDPGLLEGLRDAKTAQAVSDFLQLDEELREWLLDAPESRARVDAQVGGSTHGPPRRGGASRARRRRR